MLSKAYLTIAMTARASLEFCDSVNHCSSFVEHWDLEGSITVLKRLLISLEATKCSGETW